MVWRAGSIDHSTLNKRNGLGDAGEKKKEIGPLRVCDRAHSCFSLASFSYPLTYAPGARILAREFGGTDFRLVVVCVSDCPVTSAVSVATRGPLKQRLVFVRANTQTSKRIREIRSGASLSPCLVRHRHDTVHHSFLLPRFRVASSVNGGTRTDMRLLGRARKLPRSQALLCRHVPRRVASPVSSRVGSPALHRRRGVEQGRYCCRHRTHVHHYHRRAWSLATGPRCAPS